MTALLHDLNDHHVQWTMSSDYDFRPGGSLKLKGGVKDGGIVKKSVLWCICLLAMLTTAQEEEIQEG